MGVHQTRTSGTRSCWSGRCPAMTQGPCQPAASVGLSAATPLAGSASHSRHAAASGLDVTLLRMLHVALVPLSPQFEAAARRSSTCSEASCHDQRL